VSVIYAETVSQFLEGPGPLMIVFLKLIDPRNLTLLRSTFVMSMALADWAILVDHRFASPAISKAHSRETRFRCAGLPSLNESRRQSGNRHSRIIKR